MNFLCLHQGNGLAIQAGTVSLVNGSELLTGTGTTFTTTLSNGSIIKTSGNQFGRIAQVLSDTSALLTQIWGFAAESASTYKVVIPNSGNHFSNICFQGTVDSADASGYGFFDDSIIENCEAYGATAAGCGFVPDHARAIRIINCRAHHNANSGFSFETCEDIVTIGGSAYANGNGYQLISGSSNNTVIGMECYGNNSHGFSVSYNSPGVPIPVENTFSDISSHDNSGYALRIDGADRTVVTGSRFFNNNTGGAIINTANAHIPVGNIFESCIAYDDRSTKRQQRGFYINAGDQTEIRSCVARDADHTLAGITNSGTNTAVLTFTNGKIGINTAQASAKLGINTPTATDSLAELMVSSSAAAMRPLVLQAHPSQTGIMLDIQSSAGNSFMNISAGGLVRGPSASAAAPTFAFTQDGSTGMYRPGGVANTIRFATAANDRVQINNTATTFTHGLLFARTIIGNVNYTIQANDYLVAYTSLTAPRTVTLPTAVGATGQTYIIKDESGQAGLYTITITGTNAQLIDGAVTKTITTNYGAIALYSTGVGWASI